jgi:hypothetical protein
VFDCSKSGMEISSTNGCVIAATSYYRERTTNLEAPRSMLRPHTLQEADHGTTHGLAFDVLKGFTKSETFGSRQESRQIDLRAMTLTIVGRVAVKEVGYGHSQRSCQPFHGARAYAVDTPLVFLDLLKRHIYCRTQIGLAHAQRHATRAYSVANADVGRRRTAFALPLHE